MIFAWDEENIGHIGRHFVTPGEAEEVVELARPPFPRMVGDGKRQVWGATEDGRLLQVIYVLKEPDEVEFDSVDPIDWSEIEDAPDALVTRVIHAMDLTDDMKRQFRRRRR